MSFSSYTGISGYKFTKEVDYEEFLKINLLNKELEKKLAIAKASLESIREWAKQINDYQLVTAIDTDLKKLNE